jgi:hypothetical protein
VPPVLQRIKTSAGDYRRKATVESVRPKAGTGKAVPVGALNELATLPVDVLEPYRC